MQVFSQLLVFVSFFSLVIWTISSTTARTQLKRKSREDWLIDSAGLFIQGIVVPLLQITLIYDFYHYLFPLQQGCLHLTPILAFIISFVFIDYLYYWNHRLLHTGLLWHVHQTHHTISHMDVLCTSRNTLWASLLIVYLWVHTLFLYLLADSASYLLGVSLTSALDLWRHSGLIVPSQSWLYRCLSPWLILPQDHAWHHSRSVYHCNYGANLKLWDKLHGTFYTEEDLPKEMGVTHQRLTANS